MTRVQSLSGTKDFSSTLCIQTSSEAHAASYAMGTRSKAQPRRDADHSLLFIAEVKKEKELYLLFQQMPSWCVVGQLHCF
jgi:hypothetical protein